MINVPYLPPRNCAQANDLIAHRTFVKRERRELHALKIEFEKQRGDVCVWPKEAPDQNRCRLPNSGHSWLDAEAGDPVLCWDGSKQTWAERTIARIALYRAFPVKYCDKVVPSAREWLEGVNGIHKSEFGSLADRLPCDLRGFVPTEDTEAFDLEFDHVEDTHTVSGKLTGYGHWWQEYRWPQIVNEAVRLIEDGGLCSTTVRLR